MPQKHSRMGRNVGLRCAPVPDRGGQCERSVTKITDGDSERGASVSVSGGWVTRCKWGFLMSRMVRALGLGAVVLALATGASPALAQVESDAALVAERDAALQRMAADPRDLDAMLAHARASIRLRQFEPAVSTLERYLDLAPGNTAALYELAVSYFALGVYAVADLHFQRLEQANLDGETRRLIGQYRAAIADRTAESGVKGRVAVGLAYSTNANLASDSVTVLTRGVPLARAGGAPDGGAGATFSARVEHRHDLGLASGDLWFTEAGVEALHFFEDSDGDFDGIFLRSGPSLSLNEFAYGPKVRPYVELDTVFRGGDWLFSTAGLGAQYTNTFTADWSMYAAVRSGYRWHETAGGDGSVHRGVLGVTFRPSRDMKIQLSGLTEAFFSGADALGNVEFGGRLSAEYDFDTGLAFAHRKWRLEGYGQITTRQFLDPDAAVDPAREREDLDMRLGAKLTAHLIEGFFVTGGVDWLNRDSNIPQFEGDEVLVNLAVGVDF